MREVCLSEALKSMLNFFNLVPAVLMAFGWVVFTPVALNRIISLKNIVLISIPILISFLTLDSFPYISVMFVLTFYGMMFAKLYPVVSRKGLASRELLTYVYVLTGILVSVVVTASKGLNPDTLFFSVNVISFSLFFHVMGVRSVVPNSLLALTLIPALILKCPLGISHPVFLSLSLLSAIVEIHRRFLGFGEKVLEMKVYRSLSLMTLATIVVVFTGVGTCILVKRSERVLSLVEDKLNLVAREILEMRESGLNLKDITQKLVIPWDISTIVVEKNGNIVDVYSSGSPEKACLIGKYEKDGLRCTVTFVAPFIGLIQTVMGILLTAVILFTATVILFRYHYSKWMESLEDELKNRAVELSSANQELMTVNEELVSMSEDVERMYRELSDLSYRMSEFLHFVGNVSISDDVQTLFKKLSEAVARLLEIECSGFSVLDLNAGEIIVESGSGDNFMDLNVGDHVLRIYHNDKRLDISSDEEKFLTMVTSVVGFIIQARRAYDDLSNSEQSALSALKLLDMVMKAESREDIERILLSNARNLFSDTVLVGVGWTEDLKEDSLKVCYMRKDSKEWNTIVLKKAGIMKIVLESGEEYLSRDVEKDENFFMVDSRTRSAFAVPLKDEEDVRGVLIVERSKVNAFGRTDLNTLRLFAKMTAVSLRKIEFTKRTFLEVADVLLKTLELKDPFIKGHGRRVADYSVAIAKRLGMSNAEIEKIEIASLLHDIGKIGIRSYILDKPTKLTEEEFEEVKKHPILGEELIERIESLREIAKIIRHHHESWDGRGYPDGLRGKEIPIESRIIAIANSLDSMVNDRPYRKAYSFEKALEIIQRNPKGQWDPDIIPHAVEVFKELHDNEEGGS